MISLSSSKKKNTCYADVAVMVNSNDLEVINAMNDAGNCKKYLFRQIKESKTMQNFLSATGFTRASRASTSAPTSSSDGHKINNSGKK